MDEILFPPDKRHQPVVQKQDGENDVLDLGTLGADGHGIRVFSLYIFSPVKPTVSTIVASPEAAESGPTAFHLKNYLKRPFTKKNQKDSRQLRTDFDVNKKAGQVKIGKNMYVLVRKPDCVGD